MPQMSRLVVSVGLQFGPSIVSYDDYSLRNCSTNIITASEQHVTKRIKQTWRSSHATQLELRISNETIVL